MHLWGSELGRCSIGAVGGSELLNVVSGNGEGGIVAVLHRSTKLLLVNTHVGMDAVGLTTVPNRGTGVLVEDCAYSEPAGAPWYGMVVNSTESCEARAPLGRCR